MTKILQRFSTSVIFLASRYSIYSSIDGCMLTINIFNSIKQAGGSSHNVRSCSSITLPHHQRDVSIDEVRKNQVSKEFLLIDVRSRVETGEQGKIKGARVIPLDDLGTALMLSKKDFKKHFLLEKPKLDDKIVTMCYAGFRARTAQFAFFGAGYTNVRVYKGSYKEWQENDEDFIY